MGKYQSLIEAAKADGEVVEPESREGVKPSTRKNVNTELRKNVKTPSREAVKPQGRRDGKTARRRDVKRESVRWADTGDLITIGAKVPSDVAQHWIVEAKRQRTSLTYIITRALLDALGAPDGAVLESED